jgi:hypothetical protein
MSLKIHNPQWVGPGNTAWKNHREFISSATASDSATLDFTGLGDPSFLYYEFILFNILPATDNDELHMRAMVNGVADSGASDYSWGIQYVESIPTLQDQGDTSDSEITISNNQANLNPSSAATEGGVSGYVRWWLMHTATGCYTESHINYIISFDTQRNANVVGGGMYQPGQANGVQFKFSSGNITSGTIYCYGVR